MGTLFYNLTSYIWTERGHYGKCQIMFNIYIAQIYIWSNALLQAKVFYVKLLRLILEGWKPENPEKNPRSKGETNYDNSTHMSSKFFENQHEAIPRWSPMHPAITPSVRPSLTWDTVVEVNAITASATRAPNTPKRAQAEVLTVRIKPGGRGLYMKDRGLTFSHNDQTDEVNKFHKSNQNTNSFSTNLV